MDAGDLLPAVRLLLGSREFRGREIIRVEAVERMIGEHVACRHDWSQQLWTLFVLEIWMRLFIDKTMSRSDTLDSLTSLPFRQAVSA